MEPLATRIRFNVLFVAAAAMLYTAVVIAAGGLAGPPIKDEVHYWPASQHFSERLIPTLASIRDYDELSTPLAFMVWGELEFLFGRGIGVGRGLNLVLSFGMLCFIGLGAAANRWRSVLAACGLLLFPYYLAASAVLYTDIIAGAWCLAAVWAYRGERHIVSAVCCVGAIATRQYMIAFPLALGAHAFFQRPWAIRRAWVTQAFATGSILGWVALFGGLAPKSGLALKPMRSADVLALDPANGLYLLVCVGAYFVLPELLLLRRWPLFDWRLRYRVGGIAIALLALFVLFPPFENAVSYSVPTMGYLDKAVRFVLPDAARITLFYGLALIACVRFGATISLQRRPDLGGWLVIANAVVLTKGILAWDKYALPLLVTLWFLQARAEPSESEPVS